MNSITFNLKVLTPLFMGGANQQAELRAQSFKGMIRFWWRALKCEDDLKKLKENEIKIFGGTFDEKIYSSPLKIFVPPIDSSRSGQDIKKDYKLKFDFDSKIRCLEGSDAGIGYLLSLSSKRKYIKEGSEFEITFSSKIEDVLKQTIAAFWCAVYLGGFGARSRRGFGNLIIVNNVNDKAYGLNFIPQDTDKSIEKWFIDNLDKCFELVGGKPKTFCYSYSNLSISRIILSGNGFQNWKDALNNIGLDFLNFRKINKSKIFDVAAFGLPIRHSDKSFVNVILNDKNKEKDNGKKSLRRASPLIIKIIKFNDYYYWMVLRLAGQFVPDGYKIDYKNINKKVDYSLIDEFWNGLKNKEIILNLPKYVLDVKNKITTKGAKKVILFGSKARGDFNDKSDMDIAYESDTPIFTKDIIENLDPVDIRKVNDSLKKKISQEGIDL